MPVYAVHNCYNVYCDYYGSMLSLLNPIASHIA